MTKSNIRGRHASKNAESVRRCELGRFLIHTKYQKTNHRTLCTGIDLFLYALEISKLCSST